VHDDLVDAAVGAHRTLAGYARKRQGGKRRGYSAARR
jgi:hypothetical protein